MALSPGTLLGPYEIQSPLGAGGMGEVYRATDTRLGRDVALKILPESFSRDPDRLNRFQLETRVIAALNHPNIVAIYDVGQHNQIPFLVSELLEGENLRSVLLSGPMPQRKVIEYGVQIAQGLAAAHEKGIVHRDLKPENLFITREGRAKILDFGLAKLAHPGNEPENATLTDSPTAAGVVMGTAGYMAPEQVRGEAIDARTDIFAFGSVLFEMISGVRAFRRDTSAETMTAVLKEDAPEISAVTFSPALEHIVRRCLEKSPEQRFQSAKDLSFALGVLSGTDLSGARTAQVVPPPITSRTRWFWPTATALLALVMAAAGIWFLTHKPTPSPRMLFSIAVPGEVNHLALSPDGRVLAFVSPDEQSGAPSIFIQHIGTGAISELAGTQGASYPFWSPNSDFIGFFANGRMQKIALSGGAPQMIATVSYARGGSWGRKNIIIYAPDPGGPLWKVNSDGSGLERLTDKSFERGESSHRWPAFLPDGEHFVFLVAKFGRDVDEQSSSICLSSLQGSKKKILTTARSNPGYANGHLFFVDEKKSLNAVAFDASNGSVTGPPRVVADTIGFQPSVFYGAFAVAENGSVVYNPTASAAKSQLTWFDRSGKELGHVGEVAVQANPSISPDGNRVALDITDLKANNLDIWIYDVGQSTSTRFTFNSAEETTPVWSRDGSILAFRSLSLGSGVVAKQAQGLEPEKVLFSVSSGPQTKSAVKGNDATPNSWSADGQQILCSIQTSLGGSSGSQLLVVSASGGDPHMFFETHSSETNGQISSDGKWAAYASNESGDWEIYVTTFPTATGKWQVSRGGGSEPRWRGDGKEMFYLNPTGMLMSVSVDAGNTFSSGVPAPLFQIRGRAPISSTDLFTYDVTRDAGRFLVNRYAKPDQIPPLTIVQNVLGAPPQ